MIAESELDIDAPRDEVFDLLLDPRRLDDWVTASRGVDNMPDGNLGPGSEFRQCLRLGGATFHVRWKVVELERPRLAVWEGRGPAGSHASVRYELSENGGGTHFTYRNEYDLPGGPLGSAAGHVASRPAKHAMHKSMKRLKDLLESRR
jgi:uncharacterized protein YndB with AHSA1/START domain